MSPAYGAAIDPMVSAATAGDEDAFAELVQRHRRELHVHCYRMLGSFQEAEDRVQETFLRAWRSRHTFEGRSTYRAWLYRIATNACLESLRRRPRQVPAPEAGGRLPPYPDYPGLQPSPDRLLDELEATEPDAVAVARDTIGLAFLALIQLLPPKQRAVLIMRDVLAFSAAETAGVLDDTVAAVNSALQRARATLGRYRPHDSDHLSTGPATEDELRLVQQYIEAHERADPAAVVAMLAEDARLTISPMGMVWDGKDDITPDFMANMNSLGEFRCVATGANRQPAVANYLRTWEDDVYRAFSLVVLGIQDGQVVDMTTFVEPALFEAFGLPASL
ncbi:MAG: RNA polymerase subunit sigma-70 [Acidimicrobiia bacterium]